MKGRVRMAAEQAVKPNNLSQSLRAEGFGRRFNKGRRPVGMCVSVWQLANNLQEELRVEPGDVHLNGGSKIALKVNDRTALVVETRSGLTSSMLITGRQVRVPVLDETASGLLREFGLKSAEVLRATLGGRPTVAIAVDDEDMLLVQWMSMS